MKRLEAQCSSLLGLKLDLFLNHLGVLNRQIAEQTRSISDSSGLE